MYNIMYNFLSSDSHTGTLPSEEKWTVARLLLFVQDASASPILN